MNGDYIKDGVCSDSLNWEMNALDDLYETHRYTLIKSINYESFLPQLRSRRIFSENDEEEIKNHYIYKTKFQRNGAFIDTLKTKGQPGLKAFKDLLAWEYPHVFTAVFIDETPTPRPEGYKSHETSRISCNWNELFLHGQHLNQIRVEHNDMIRQIDELQELLQFAQNEKKELENEIQRLREFEIHNRQLRENIKEIEKDNRLVKEENRDFMRRNIHLRDDNDQQSHKISSLLHKVDDLERQLDCNKADLDRLNECQNEWKENFEQERRISQRLHRQCNDLRTVRTRPVNLPNKHESSDKHLHTKIEILMADLEAERENNRTLVIELEEARNENYADKDTINRLMTDVFKLKKDAEKNALWQNKAEKNNEEYFKKIQQLQKEKRIIEEEKIVCQTKQWDLDEEKNNLFHKNHELERKLERFKREYEKLKDDIMRERLNTYRQQKKKKPVLPPSAVDELTSSSLRNYTITQQKSSTLPAPAPCSINTEQYTSDYCEYDKEPTRDTIKARPAPEIKKKSLEKSDSTIAQLGYPYDCGDNGDEEDEIYTDFQRTNLMHSMSRSSISSQESSLPEYFEIDDILVPNSPARILKVYEKEHPVLLSVNTLNSVKLTCNGDQIEVMNLQIDDANISIGDIIVQIKYRVKGEDIEQVLNGMTLDEANKAVQKCIESKPDIVTVYIVPGAKSKKQFLDQGKFYIRTNIEYKGTEYLPLVDGEVVFVQEMKGNEHWYAVKTDQKSGRLMKVGGCIPNMEEAKKLMQPSSKSDSQTAAVPRAAPLQRNGAFRMRDGKPGYSSPYTVVMPMRACTLLPISIRGPDVLVSAILDTLKLTASDWAKVIRRKKWSEMIREDKHVIFGSSLSVSDCDLNRFIVINVKSDKKNHLERIFGKDIIKNFDVSDYKDNLVTERNSKNLVFDESISDKLDMLRVLQDHVKSLQNSIFWIDVSHRW
ncbi:uncharacterized protein LOC126810052 isoform X2 [Patella vulgata]|uniref:uncharacterized protein LOC126810052 isoform X2 n=1 Tax=Patella vulgata TaxID=6465 RepID=UPI0021802276|nr:uncharacterized protein LOC126810052 isoform X2 [Patella vulgata]